MDPTRCPCSIPGGLCHDNLLHGRYARIPQLDPYLHADGDQTADCHGDTTRAVARRYRSRHPGQDAISVSYHYGQSYAPTHGNSVPNGHAIPGANLSPYTDRLSYTYPVAYSHGDAKADAPTDCHIGAIPFRDTNSDIKPYTKAHGHPNAFPGTNSDPKPYTKAHGHPNAFPGTNSDRKPQTDPVWHQRAHLRYGHPILWSMGRIPQRRRAWG